MLGCYVIMVLALTLHELLNALEELFTGAHCTVELIKGGFP
jgi:hypothetical protein